MSWYRVANVDELSSPSLLVWPERVGANIARMIERVGGEVDRLRPHVKTHKLAEVVRLQLDAGISKFKCATIAEAEMTAGAGATDILLAYQPVGPNLDRLLALASAFPATHFSCVVDCAPIAGAIVEAIGAAGVGSRVGVLVDIDCGMQRTGIAPGDGAKTLCRLLAAAGVWDGLHVYDGHIHDPGEDQRREAFDAAFAEVEAFIAALTSDGLVPPQVVGGGSPTFGLHAVEKGWQCSPGTTLFWDAGYSSLCPDLGYGPAALVLSRVISKPGKNRLCLDLGHKAVAAENPLERRVRFLNLPQVARPVSQSEEHLVMEFPGGDAGVDEWNVGDIVYGVPWHICPTVALHQEAVVIRDGHATGERWTIEARNRRLTI